MNLPASQAAGRFPRFPQALGTMPIRAEGQRVNFPLARRQAPQRLTNGERAALQYQPGSSLLPVPALEASARGTGTRRPPRCDDPPPTREHSPSTGAGTRTTGKRRQHRLPSAARA
jgi:hypothetical protein